MSRQPPPVSRSAGCDGSWPGLCLAVWPVTAHLTRRGWCGGERAAPARATGRVLPAGEVRRPHRLPRPPGFYRRLQAIAPVFGALGLTPRYVVRLEVPGRRTGVIRAFHGPSRLRWAAVPRRAGRRVRVGAQRARGPWACGAAARWAAVCRAPDRGASRGARRGHPRLRPLAEASESISRRYDALADPVCPRH